MRISMSTSMPASPSRTSITVAASRTSTMSAVLDLWRGTRAARPACQLRCVDRRVPRGTSRPAQCHTPTVRSPSSSSPASTRHRGSANARVGGRAADRNPRLTNPGITRSTPPTAFRKRSISSFVRTSPRCADCCSVAMIPRPWRFTTQIPTSDKDEKPIVLTTDRAGDRYGDRDLDDRDRDQQA